MLSRPPPTGEKHLHLFIPTQNQSRLRSRRHINCLHTIVRIALIYSLSLYKSVHDSLLAPVLLIRANRHLSP